MIFSGGEQIKMMAKSNHHISSSRLQPSHEIINPTLRLWKSLKHKFYPQR